MEKQRYEEGDWVNDSRYPEHDWIQLGQLSETNNGRIIYHSIQDDSYIWQRDIGEKWKPKKEEWCWLDKVGLIKIMDILKEKDKFSYITIESNDIKTNILSNSMLQPFIGKLPTFID